jgi:hypothetical protein
MTPAHHEEMDTVVLGNLFIAVRNLNVLRKVFILIPFQIKLLIKKVEYEFEFKQSNYSDQLSIKDLKTLTKPSVCSIAIHMTCTLCNYRDVFNHAKVLRDSQVLQFQK